MAFRLNERQKESERQRKIRNNFRGNGIKYFDFGSFRQHEYRNRIRDSCTPNICVRGPFAHTYEFTISVIDRWKVKEERPSEQANEKSSTKNCAQSKIQRKSEQASERVEKEPHILQNGKFSLVQDRAQNRSTMIILMRI